MLRRASARTTRRTGPAVRGRMSRRVPQFSLGLGLCATGVWLSLQADLGLAPWDVLHAGLADLLGLSMGTVLIALGAVVVGVSALMGVRPGWGTLANAVVVGVALDLLLATPWLDGVADGAVLHRVLALVASVVVLAAGIALYIGAGFGAGPRDSLMVAFHRYGLPIGLARAGIEIGVLLLGWLLGGPVGVGTAVLALATGPMVQVSFRALRQRA